MTPSKTSLILFGETVELRTSLLMGAGIPINCFFTNGQTIADLALIRPYDGLVQYDDATIATTVETVRQRNSSAYRLFFALATPVLLLIDLIFALLRGVGRFFAAMSIFGIFSAIIGLVALAVFIMTLGAMAMVLVYALPVLAVVYLVRVSYRSSSDEAARKIKEACRKLADQSARDDNGESSVETIDVAAMEIQPVKNLPMGGDVRPQEYGAAPTTVGLSWLRPQRVGRDRAQSRLLRQIALGTLAGFLAGGLGTGGVIAVRSALPTSGGAGFPSSLIGQAQGWGDQIKAVLAGSPEAPARAPKSMAPPPPPLAPAVATVLPNAAVPVTGPVRLVDTATLAMGERVLPLQGIAPVDRAEARQSAADYLAAKGGQVECQPAGARWSCVVGPARQDVSEVLALSGLAVALPDASDPVRKAEAEARGAKRGIWSTF